MCLFYMIQLKEPTAFGLFISSVETGLIYMNNDVEQMSKWSLTMPSVTPTV